MGQSDHHLALTFFMHFIKEHFVQDTGRIVTVVMVDEIKIIFQYRILPDFDFQFLEIIIRKCTAIFLPRAKGGGKFFIDEPVAFLEIYGVVNIWFVRLAVYYEVHATLRLIRKTR